MGGRVEAERPTLPPDQLLGREISDLYGFDGLNGVWRRVAVDPMGNLIVNTGGDVVDDDDNDIAEGQTTGLEIVIQYIHDGSKWVRQQGGVDNDPAPASPQGSFVGGVVTDPVGVFADGDISLFHFDTSGRLLVAGGGGVGVGTTITTPADTAVGIGATVALPVPPVAPATTRMTVQNTGPAGSFIRVREVGAGAGRGALLGRFSSVTYGGPGGSIAPLEVEDVSGAVTGTPVATSAMIQFERA